MNKNEAPMELSRRLAAVAGLVTEGASVADIGTDHGYIPIWLVETGRCSQVIASDVNRGPADRAAEHIRARGLEDRIQVRCADGLAGIAPGEVQTMIAAGMGGPLMLRILEEAPETVRELREFILQPQSELAQVREYLNRHGFRLTDEEMVEEDGKYYPVLKLEHGREPAYSKEELRYGRLLLRRRHPVLKKYLLREKRILRQILTELSAQPAERVAGRKAELEAKLTEIDGLLADWNNRRE